jgi:hypothetical protein
MTHDANDQVAERTVPCIDSTETVTTCNRMSSSSSFGDEYDECERLITGEE